MVARKHFRRDGTVLQQDFFGGKGSYGNHVILISFYKNVVQKFLEVLGVVGKRRVPCCTFQGKVVGQSQGNMLTDALPGTAQAPRLSTAITIAIAIAIAPSKDIQRLPARMIPFYDSTARAKKIR